jgi:hypothetical protein
LFTKTAFALVALACLTASPAAAQGRVCRDVSGMLNEFILPQGASTDPFGRIVGVVKGDLEGAVTAWLTTFVPSPSGSVRVTNNHAFANAAGDQFFTRGAADWTIVIPGFYWVDMTLVIQGGTGKYESATGSIKLQGIGNNIAPGTGQFIDHYKGEICVNQS